MSLWRRVVGVEAFEGEDDVSPAGTAERRVLHLDHRPAGVGNLFPTDRIGIPQVIERTDSETKVPGLVVFGPFEEDETFLRVIADNLQGVAVAWS